MAREFDSTQITALLGTLDIKDQIVIQDALNEIERLQGVNTRNKIKFTRLQGRCHELVEENGKFRAALTLAHEQLKQNPFAKIFSGFSGS